MRPCPSKESTSTQTDNTSAEANTSAGNQGTDEAQNNEPNDGANEIVAVHSGVSTICVAYSLLAIVAAATILVG